MRVGLFLVLAGLSTAGGPLGIDMWPVQAGPPRGTSGSASAARPSVSMVIAEPSFFYGRKAVFEQAVVERFVTPYLFEIRDKDGHEDEPLLVMAPAPVRLPPDGSIVIVEGEVRQFLPAQFATEFAWFEKATAGVSLEDFQDAPVVLATRVELPAGTSLIMR